ncbi:MAG: glycoside hydrolase family 2 [Gemmatimonadetes bacterium]|nr:glycoside hydrolase family 2 [Gemmatimonadota bacterium]
MSRRFLLVLALFAPPLAAQNPQNAPTLRTRWADSVSQVMPLPEYPRPQMARPNWVNLNGPWAYAIAPKDAPRPSTWTGSILVPYPIESQLSGVQRAVTPAEKLWYRRNFTRPASVGANGRLLLHFGAVDWQATVWVNGKQVGSHEGGYDPFSFDITDALTASGTQEVVVAVWDPTDNGSQPRGKQVLKPDGIWYTAVTGIWQTVWLEPVPGTRIASIVITPDLDARAVRVRSTLSGQAAGLTTRVTVSAADRVVAMSMAPPTDSDWSLVIDRPRLWSPADPFLYGVRVELLRGDSVIDRVTSQVGIRKIALGKDAKGVTRLFFNNKPLFQYGPLDQGWWPDGLYTPPTDHAMLYDLVTTKALGFNMIRKHVKVEPARWYYMADSLGILVWQDMPSGDNKTPESRAAFAKELQAKLDALRSFTSIVMWVPFNEGWGQHDTEKTVAWVKAYDPSRLVNNASGWTDMKVGDVSDVHSYPGPGMPALEPNRAAVLGEFGGLGLPLAGHTWLAKDNWGYKSYPDGRALSTAYAELMHQLKFLVDDGLSAAVYTQTSDVEIEVNGLMTYDRSIIKLMPDAIASSKQLYGPPSRVRRVVPTSQTTGQPWRYTTTAPAADWFATRFNDAAWQAGIGGFGKTGTPGAVIRTPWTTNDIWLRRSFTLKSGKLVAPHWYVHHDEDADVYLNGKLVATFSGYSSGYMRIPLDATARAALKAGRNVLAVHVRQTRGGQYIDLGLDEVITP